MNDLFVQLMKKVALALGNDNFEVQDNNYAIIGLDETLLSFQYLEEADQVLIYADILELPTKNNEEFYQAILEGQFFFEKTAGFTLAINKSLNILLLQSALSMRILDENIMLQVMENFMNVADYWREELAPFYTDAPTQSQEISLEDSSTMMRV